MRRVLFFQYAIIALEVIAIITRATGLNLFADPGFHHFWSDVFFVNFTFLGDGWFAIFLVGYLAYIKSPVWKKMAIVSGLTMLLVQLLKNLYVGGDWQFYVEEGQYLHFVNPENLNGRLIPVSGHTALAFALAGIWVSVLKYRTQVIALAAAAVLVAVSRMYLAGQGLTALTTGALTGLMSVTLIEAGLAAYRRINFNVLGSTGKSLTSETAMPA